MSGMMLHGLGDCTPELNCGCVAKSPRDVLRKRIARALLEFPLNGCHCPVESPCGRCLSDSEEMADAVVAALGLVEERERGAFTTEDSRVRRLPASRRWVTPWERIEEDA